MLHSWRIAVALPFQLFSNETADVATGAKGHLKEPPAQKVLHRGHL
jgi:hypothetical protein